MRSTIFVLWFGVFWFILFSTNKIFISETAKPKPKLKKMTIFLDDQNGVWCGRIFYFSSHFLSLSSIIIIDIRRRNHFTVRIDKINFFFCRKSICLLLFDKHLLMLAIFSVICQRKINVLSTIMMIFHFFLFSSVVG